MEKRASAEASFQYEVIIVSDGSKDRTVEVAQTYSKKYTANKLRVLALTENRGKGGAVRLVRIFFGEITVGIEQQNLIYFSFTAGNAKCTWPSIVVCRCGWCN